jgi:iron(III) transport system substrate-binding protein
MSHHINIGVGRRQLLQWTAAAGVLTAVPSHAAEATLTIYAAQHQQMVDMVTKAFTKETGVAVKSRFGEAPELASLLVREGAKSPADVFFTENSPELVLLDEKKLLAPVDKATLQAIPSQYSSQNGQWVGLLGRENVLVFDPAKVEESALPASIYDLAKPSWKGKVAIAPSDADFLPLIAASVALKGREATLAWLKGLKTNAAVFEDDEGVAAAVERGAAATGVINSYYYYRMRVEAGPEGTKSKVHHFSGGDLGGLLNVSGAGILKSSKHPAEAQRFLAFLVSKPVQEMIAQSDIDFEYPLLPGVAANAALLPMDKLQPPALSVKQLGDDTDAAKLLRQAGLL